MKINCLICGHKLIEKELVNPSTNKIFPTFNCPNCKNKFY